MFAKLKSFVEQSFVYTLGGVLMRGLSFVLLPLYTRVLTPDDYGILGAINPINSILSIFLGLGIQNAVMRFYFDYRDDPAKLRAYLGTVSLFMMGSSLIVASFLTAVGPWLFGLILSQTPFHPYVLLAIWSACIANLQFIPITIFRAQQQPGRFTLFTVGHFLLSTLLTIFFVAVLLQGPKGSLLARVIAGLLMVIPTLWVIVRNSSLQFSWTFIRLSLAFSLPLLPHTLGQWLLNLSDRIILENIVSKSDLGLYTLAYQFGLIINVIALALNNAWVPFFYEHAGEHSDANLLPRFITYQILAMTALGLSLVLLSREVIEIMARSVYWDAYRLVPWVVLGYLARFLYLFPVNGIFFSKDTRWVPIATFSAGMLNVVLNLWLVPHYGTTAAAINTSIGFLALFLIVYTIGQRLFPIRYEYGRLARVALPTIGIFAVGWWLAPGGLWLRLIFKVCLLSTFPLLLGLSGFFSVEERKRLVWLLQNIRSRLALRQQF